MNIAHLELATVRAAVPQIRHSVERGGVDAGPFLPPDGSRPYHLIVALLPETWIEPTRWGRYGEKVDATSDWDGLANTEAILRADPGNVIARHIRGLDVDGHRDFHWASKLETDHVYRNLGSLVHAFLANGCAWSSTQYSATLAWRQLFDVGYTGPWYKDNLAGALAVRRFYPLILQ